MSLANLFGHPDGEVLGVNLDRPEIGERVGEWAEVASFVAARVAMLATNGPVPPFQNMPMQIAGTQVVAD